MRRDSFLVGPHGVRPAGPDDRCFYCNVAVGEEHETACVIRSRTVVLRLTTEYVRSVPEDWDEEAIRFFFNDGTWCTDNALEEIKEHAGDGCICWTSKVEFVREATEDDEARSALNVAGLPS